MLFCLYLFYPSQLETLQPEVVIETTVVTPKTDGEAVQRPKKTILEEDSQLPLPNRPTTLRNQLAAQFSYDLESTFPSFIWQTWKTTPSDPDFEFRGPEATWTEKHPDYIHEVRSGHDWGA